MPTAYCPACRTTYGVDANPPYAVIHISPSQHLHALTRQPITEDSTP